MSSPNLMIFKSIQNFLSIVQPLGRLWSWPWPWPSTKIMVKEMTQQFENMKPNDHRWRLFMQNSSQLSILAPDQSRRKETQARPMVILLCIPSLNITRLHSTSTCCPVYQWTLPTFKSHYKKKRSKLQSSQKQENNKIETWWLGGVPQQPHLWCYSVYSKLTPSRSWKSKFLQLLRCPLLLDFFFVFFWFLCSKKELPAWLICCQVLKRISGGTARHRAGLQLPFWLTRGGAAGSEVVFQQGLYYFCPFCPLMSTSDKN